MIDETDVKLGMMLGTASHPQTVIDDLWTHAQTALGGTAGRLSAVVVYVDDGTHHVVPRGMPMEMVGLRPKTQGALASMAQKLSTKASVAGIIGRLLRDNLHSRRVANALSVHPEGRALLCGSDVVVSADPAADRAVWQLRNLTSAQLMHGPFAMMNALRKTIK
ncbi:hypothetical protein ART_1650 [Arthrobacter sp. PAMC 25486]|uniref:hypothetical protein n=1 Tax=Arthrobacter sp. PAMC 25486 TaxID=1494608 RepID=UPI00053628D4|nr:hypothetical protein [Arthrobacter sp. PAMC 25486]AIY01249.1 hypothetical protein ART_1650 [Arthrobacter sp. PAMC 25486]